MEEVLKFFITDVKVDRKDVLNLIDCREDSPVYGEVLKEFAEVETAFYECVKPQTRLLFDSIPPEIADAELPAGTKVIYHIHTVGSDINEWSTQAFLDYDYLKGMIMDAMGSTYLFEIENKTQAILKRECAARGFGIVRRLEAPLTIPMLSQKIARDKLFPEPDSVVKITSAYMLDPPKSVCQIYVLSDDRDVFLADHDCSVCDQMNCPMRKKTLLKVKIMDSDKTHIITRFQHESILETMRRDSVYNGAACGASGKCGKCKIRFLEGVSEPSAADRVHFPQQDLDAGIRLACRAYPKTDCTIRMGAADESGYEILSGSAFFESLSSDFPETRFAVAVDIGTTTIAAALVGLASGKPIAFCTALNRQRMYGADVISRIQASTDGKGDQLRNLVREDILQIVQHLLEDNKVTGICVEQMILAGNTTMVHLLLGYPCNTLGVSPFTPYSIKKEELVFAEVFASDILSCPVIIFPGISTFVGGDIVSGLLACGFADAEKLCLFIDLGTNGEMAVGNKDRILATSTAAGPAFEGGNILWGTGSIPGAICSVAIDGEAVRIETIGNQTPVGICGTGIIEVVSELLKNNIFDETGLLEDRYFAAGFPVAATGSGEAILVSQRDIREIQLAKAAVHAGIEVLLRRFGTDYSGIDTVWLAGGFGVKIDREKAIRIGMLPQEFEGKIRAVGNSSLSGAVSYCLHSGQSGKMEQIVSNASEISLSNDKDFNQLYVDYMYF